MVLLKRINSFFKKEKTKDSSCKSEIIDKWLLKDKINSIFNDPQLWELKHKEHHLGSNLYITTKDSIEEIKMKLEEIWITMVNDFNIETLDKPVQHTLKVCTDNVDHILCSFDIKMK